MDVLFLFLGYRYCGAKLSDCHAIGSPEENTGREASTGVDPRPLEVGMLQVLKIALK